MSGDKAQECNKERDKRMNATEHMIIIKGEIKTSEIRFCQYNANTQRMDVEFTNGRKYPYAYYNVEWLKKPIVLNPDMYRISKNGREFFDIKAIYVFIGTKDAYWHICFGDGEERDYCQRELKIVESCLSQGQSGNVFEYIKKIADLSDLKDEESGEKMLAKKFKKISFVGNDVALAKYLNPPSLQPDNMRHENIPIFPFGCNNSQYKAVKRAMENQISVIQGPPGTGKTQTILNIIANILMQGKNVQIVSNNNSATKNVYEKLSSPKYNLGFVVATLGSSKNKKMFVEQQDAEYPDFTSWKMEEDPSALQKNISEKSMQLKDVFDKQERLANLRQEHSQLTTEFEHFKQYLEKTNVNIDSLRFRKKASSEQWMAMLQECQMVLEEKKKIGIIFKIKAFFNCGIVDSKFYKQDVAKIIITFQVMYYRARQAELTREIEDIEKYLDRGNKDLLDDLWKESYSVLEEYPVILSTTFSSRSSLNTDVIYDYLIMDEYAIIGLSQEAA